MGCVNGCKTTRYLDDDAFLSDILGIVNKAIGNPELLRLPYSDDDLYSPSIKVQRDERTLSDLLQKDTVTFQSAKKVYFDIVTEKFESCKPDNSGAVTEALISYMENYGPIETVDLTLFKTILDKILVDESGEIALKFINGAVLKKIWRMHVMNNTGVQVRTKTVTKIAANPALSKRNDPNRVLRVAA